MNAKAKVRVRMYRVGFGDCFLISTPAGSHILIDCGVHPQGDLGRLEDAANDIAKVTDGHLNVVVATHRHADHVSGFAKAKEVFAGIEVDEVWMPWTEDPKDKDAIALRATCSKFELALTQRLAAQSSPLAADLHAMNLANESAMAVLQGGFKGKAAPRYLSSEDGKLSSAALPDVEVTVLGPPRDRNILDKKDPPKDQSYLAGGKAGTDGAVSPFHKGLHLDAKAARRLFGNGLASRFPSPDGDGTDALALAYDELMNNTSIILLLRIGKAMLLFPGDAQWGPWKAILNNGRADVLKDVDLYKASHHGSHNGTPKDLVEAFPEKGLVSAVPVTPVKKFGQIPRGPLMDALRKRGRVVRSDKAPKESAASAGKLWIDLGLPC